MAIDLKKLDRFFWRPASIVGAVGSLFFKSVRKQSDTLIIRPGGMGDLILLVLAAEEMGEKPLDWDWLIEKRSESWAKLLGLKYTCYDRSTIQVHWQIAGRYARVLNTEQRFGLSQATALLARGRGGVVAGFSTNLAASTFDVVVEYDASSTHETVAFSRLLAAASQNKKPLTCRPARVRARAETQGKIVALGGLQAPSRALSADQWKSLINSWTEGASVCLVASPADEEFARSLAQKLTNVSAVVIGSDFQVLCNLLAQASDVLTVDGGSVHMAAYFGVPVTAIFTAGREQKWAPCSAGSRMIRTSGLACQPCTIFGQVPECPNSYACKSLDFRRDLKPI
jgi:hypothetical protein